MKTYQNFKSWGKGKSSECSQLTGQKTTTAKFIHGRFYGNESFHFPSILRGSPLSRTLFIAFFFIGDMNVQAPAKVFGSHGKKITSNGSMFGKSPIWDSRRELLFSPGFRKAHWICNGLNTPLTKVKYVAFYIVIHHFSVIFRFS